MLFLHSSNYVNNTVTTMLFILLLLSLLCQTLHWVYKIHSETNKKMLLLHLKKKSITKRIPFFECNT